MKYIKEGTEELEHIIQQKVPLRAQFSSAGDEDYTMTPYEKLIMYKEKEDIAVFLNVCDKYHTFFVESEIDYTLLIMCFIYLKRAGLLAKGYSDFKFMCALHLASAVALDCGIFITRRCIVAACIGSKPKQKEITDVVERTKKISEYKTNLDYFHSCKNKIWKRLNFRTHVTFEEMLDIIKLFPRHNIFSLEVSERVHWKEIN